MIYKNDNFLNIIWVQEKQIKNLLKIKEMIDQKIREENISTDNVHFKNNIIKFDAEDIKIYNDIFTNNKTNLNNVSENDEILVYKYANMIRKLSANFIKLLSRANKYALHAKSECTKK